MAKKAKQNDNNNAIAYYRYSSHSQNEASIEQQREQAMLYAEKHGYKLIKEYEDRAISGTTDQRPGFQQMLAEVGKLKPAVLILWKTDRLGRDRYLLAYSKKIIRDSGCAIHYVAEATPTDNSPEAALMEGLMESFAEFYSNQLRQNVTRGMRYNAENCLYNGHKMLGYKVDDTKHYVIDENTAPIVQWIFKEYANGKPMTEIAKELNNQGIRTTLGKKFNVNGLRHILKNRAYIGYYIYSDIEIKDGMPRIISDTLFEEVQKRFELNKHKAIKPQEDPRYWLTGKLYCGECGTTMHGLSGTSKTGKIHYYYACKNHRKHKCDLPNINKEMLEVHVLWILMTFLQDIENLTSLAVDLSVYYKEINSVNNGYIDSLKNELKETESAINNLIKVIEKGVISDTVTKRLEEMEVRKHGLQSAIETEQIKQQLVADDYSIQHFFDKYEDFDFDDAEVRDNILEYFVDKIYVYKDRVVITWNYTGDTSEIDLGVLTQITDDSDDFDTSESSSLPQSCPPRRCRRHIVRSDFFAKVTSHSFCRSSSPNRTRCAGLRFGFLS